MGHETPHGSMFRGAMKKAGMQHAQPAVCFLPEYGAQEGLVPSPKLSKSCPAFSSLKSSTRTPVAKRLS